MSTQLYREVSSDSVSIRHSLCRGDRLRRSKPTDVRRGVYELLEQGPIGERRTRFVSRLIILMIIVNLVAAALETVPALDAEYGRLFAMIEWLSLVDRKSTRLNSSH